MKKTFLSILLVLVSGCTSQFSQPTTTMAPTITSTPQPSNTPKPTQIATLHIPTNPGFFEGVGEIASVEEHEGKWYGIDTIGRAEIVYGYGMWLKYERPIEFTGMPGQLDAVPKELLQDVDQKDITRLNDNGTPLEWGVIKVDDYPGVAKHFYVSGYPLGTYDFYVPENKQSYKLLLFEIPLRYTRQLLNFLIFAQNTAFSGLSAIPASGNIQEVHQKTETFTTLMSMMSNPDIRGHQQVLAFQAKTSQENDMKLGNSLVDGIAVSVPRVQLLSRAWIEESFFPK